jgi:predicted DNA-binding protein
MTPRRCRAAEGAIPTNGIAGRTSTEEVTDMSQSPSEGSRPNQAKGHKTLAIRLEDDVHAQLVMLAQLAGRPLIEEIREAIQGHIARKRESGELAERISEVLAEIEREAATKKSAIEALYHQATSPPPKGRSKGTSEPSS